MNYHEFREKTLPSIMLVHGGGNAWWNYLRQARALSDRYHVILPTLDGHGTEHAIPYVSTEKTADQLLAYLDQHCGLFGGLLFSEKACRRQLKQMPKLLPSKMPYPEEIQAYSKTCQERHGKPSIPSTAPI